MDCTFRDSAANNRNIMALFLENAEGKWIHLAIHTCGPNGRHLRDWISKTGNLPAGDILLSHNGLLVQEDDSLISDGFYHVSLRLRGGKGGFGSMLRMLGAQIEKTTNHEACRDLSGRRMRDVNNEKKLADWIAKKADREREREERRQAKLERLRSEPRHHFVDPNYHKQKSEVSDSLDEAITQGINASVDVPSTSSGDKRKHDEDLPGGSKKSRLWVGVEGDVDSDSDSDDSEDESEMPPSVKVEKDQQTDDSSGQEDPQTNQELSSTSHESLPPITVKDVSSNQDLPATSCDGGLPVDIVIKEQSGESTSNGCSTEMDGTTSEITNSVTREFNLDKMETAAELESFGLERLKTELTSRGLKCGGTLQERAQRLFAVKGLSPDQIDPSLKAKPSKGKKKQKTK